MTKKKTADGSHHSPPLVADTTAADNASARETATADHAAAVAQLAALKQAEPRDADAILAQKLRVQELAAALAAPAPETTT